jgi:hypothetical protein
MAPIVKAIQEQHQIIENQNKKIEKLEQLVEILLKNQTTSSSASH